MEVLEMERENMIQLNAEITCPPSFPYYYIRNFKASTGKSSGSKLGLFVCFHCALLFGQFFTLVW